MLISEMEHNMSEFGNASTNLVPQFRFWYKHGPSSLFMLYTDWDCSFFSYDNLENNLTSYPATNRTTWITPTNDILNCFNLMIIVIVLVCPLGFLGNGRVIWLLGFSMKRNPFTTYIMNLSIADFGVLTCLLSISSFTIAMNWYAGSPAFCHCFNVVFELFSLTYSSSQFLLAIISIDRCVAVLFPIWHRCHRPPYLSTVLCAIIWVVSTLLSGIHFTLLYVYIFDSFLFFLRLIVNVLLCTPIMVISALTLLIKICCKPKQHLRGKLVRAILLALLFFLIFCLPLNLSYIIEYLSPIDDVNYLLRWIGFACASLNSSINPLIYFLVGRRQKKGWAKVSMKVALERVFKDEQDAVEEETPMEESHV